MHRFQVEDFDRWLHELNKKSPLKFDLFVLGLTVLVLAGICGMCSLLDAMGR